MRVDEVWPGDEYYEGYIYDLGRSIEGFISYGLGGSSGESMVRD